ncbi:hypothetical protein BKA80DRAFT_48066 [Phyllosticta citrichinensis]
MEPGRRIRELGPADGSTGASPPQHAASQHHHSRCQEMRFPGKMSASRGHSFAATVKFKECSFTAIAVPEEHSSTAIAALRKQPFIAAA